jgi:hypothetical protein
MAVNPTATTTAESKGSEMKEQLESTRSNNLFLQLASARTSLSTRVSTRERERERV